MLYLPQNNTSFEMLTHIFQSEIKIMMKTGMHMNNKYMLNRKNHIASKNQNQTKENLYIFVDKLCALAR